MSVKGCFTDFHIDFGGTSVWYHVFRGGKVSGYNAFVEGGRWERRGGERKALACCLTVSVFQPLPNPYALKSSEKSARAVENAKERKDILVGT